MESLINSLRVIANNANFQQITRIFMEIKDKIIFPELSYRIIGAAFRVFNELGWGFSEAVYQKALIKEFKERGIVFKSGVYIPLKYEIANIGRYFADFIIEDQILLELKVVSRLGYTHAKQTLNYLKSSGIKLGILVYFTKDGVKYRRILNSNV